jgi:hypothetical protein
MINITGVSDARIAPIAAHTAEEESQTIIIVPTLIRAQRLASDLSFLSEIKKFSCCLKRRRYS